MRQTRNLQNVRGHRRRPRAPEGGQRWRTQPAPCKQGKLGSWQAGPRSHSSARIHIEHQLMRSERLTSCGRASDGHTSAQRPSPKDSSRYEKPPHFLPLGVKSAHFAWGGGEGTRRGLPPISDPEHLQTRPQQGPRWPPSCRQRTARDGVSITLAMLDTFPKPHQLWPGRLH